MDSLWKSIGDTALWLIVMSIFALLAFISTNPFIIALSFAICIACLVWNVYGIMKALEQRKK